MKIKETKRGRRAGQVKDVGYIIIDDDIRIKIEEDNLTIQERTSTPSEDNDGDIFGNNHYYTSWDGILKWLIRHYTTKKISKKKEWLFTDARKEIVNTMGEVVDLIIGSIDKAEREAQDKLKKFII